jgi:hypothetical protein
MDCLGVERTTSVVEGLVCRELRGPAVFQIFNPWKEGSGVIYPETFFLAAGELLVTMIGVSFVITFITNPRSALCYDPPAGSAGEGSVIICDNSTLELNSIKLRVGHSNPCVAFDMPPAKYFAALIYVFAAYCGIRYSILDMERTIRISKTEGRMNCCTKYFSLISDFLYGCAWAGFVMTYVIPPWKNIWGHSMGFICLGSAQFLIFASNIIEGENFPLCVYIFAAVYGIFTVGEFGFAAGANYIHWENTGEPLLPDLLGTFIDYGWFFMLAVTSAVMPRSEGLVRSTKIELSPFQTGDEYGKGEGDDDEDSIPLNDEEMGAEDGEDEDA